MKTTPTHILERNTTNFLKNLKIGPKSFSRLHLYLPFHWSTLTNCRTKYCRPIVIGASVILQRDIEPMFGDLIGDGICIKKLLVSLMATFVLVVSVLIDFGEGYRWNTRAWLKTRCYFLQSIVNTLKTQSLKSLPR